MINDRETAARKAEASTTNVPNTCQLWTRNLFNAPSAGDYDGDGSADAEDGWKMEKRKHPGDRNPPRGVPVAYLGGSKDNGHRAISLGGGLIRSTDAGGRGVVATVDLGWPERVWGLTYAGWSEDIDGQLIPLPPKPAKKDKPKRSPKHVPGAWAKFAHITPYYKNDSIDGLKWAATHGYNAIDLNFHVTRDRVIVNTHWAQPLLHGFRDPKGKIAKNAQIKDLTWREVARLRAPGGHRIRTMNRMLLEAKKRHLRVEFEAKNSPAFTDPAIWARVKKRADQLHLSLQMKVESWVAVPGGAPAILRAARAGGIGARIVLPRGKRVLRKNLYWGPANYVRGAVVWR